jgi:hypothetical protein
MYERVGFVDVHECVYKVPLNGWAKDKKLEEIGNMMELNMQMGLSAFSLGLFNRVYGRTPEEIEVRYCECRFSKHATKTEKGLANNVVAKGVPCRSPARRIRSIDSCIHTPLCRLGQKAIPRGKRMRKKRKERSRNLSPFIWFFNNTSILEDSIVRDTRS